MTMDVRINGQSLRDIMDGPPKISDSMDATCRTMELAVIQTASLDNKLGQPIELWYNGSRWYYGILFKRTYSEDGKINYLCYDPLRYMKNQDDHYYKYRTGNQIIKDLATKNGIPIGKIAPMGYTLPPLWYQGAEADKVAVDVIARTYQATKRKYWYRFNPGVEDFGLTLFERVTPTYIWAFMSGINLTKASYEESIENTITVVKLVNRETGKVVTKTDVKGKAAYGTLQHFEEVDKDHANQMDQIGAGLLKSLSQVAVTSSIEGINPNQTMPQLYSGDTIYVEEKHTQLLGAYHITNITQEFASDKLITLAIDIQKAPDIPAIQFDDATTNPKAGV